MWITVSSRVLVCSAADPELWGFHWGEKFPREGGESFSALLCFMEDLRNRSRTAAEAECLHCYTWPWSVTMLSAFPPALLFQLPSFRGWSWIMEIDYAVTTQIPLPRAWPQCVWLQVGQACLRDAPPAAPEKGRSAAPPPPPGSRSLPAWRMGGDHSRRQEGMKTSRLEYRPCRRSRPGSWWFPTLPAPRHHVPRVIRLYQPATLMTSSLTPGRRHANSFKFLKKSWITSRGASRVLGVLNIFASSHVRVIPGKRMKTFNPLQNYPETNFSRT